MNAIESGIFFEKFKVSSISVTYLPDTYLMNEIPQSEDLISPTDTSAEYTICLLYMLNRQCLR
jgi:hypothetical protein